MTGIAQNHENVEPKARVLGYTEHSWCRAVSCGTGITVLALEMSKSLEEIPLLHNVIHKLQKAHPILNYRLHYNTTKKEFSFSKSTIPQVLIESFDPSSTLTLLYTLSKVYGSKVSPSHLILQHELNNNIWSDPTNFPEKGIEVMFTKVYALNDTKCVVTLRFHTSICDRTTAITLLRELLELAKNENENVERAGTWTGIKNDGEGNFGIENLIPSGKSKKTMWAHGLDMLGYSVNSFRLTNLKFKDSKWPRHSEVVRLQMSTQATARILAGCKSRGIKLCGALAAAGLMAAHSSKRIPDQQKKKYGVVTLTDCRSLLDPPLSTHHFGFYHSAILNIHVVKGGENLWDLAKKCYTSFANSKECNRHFSDMTDLNFLMCKAIDNPSVTASSSLRTSLISVFEDPVFDETYEIRQQLGVDNYIGCASVHGVGPSIAIFDTIRDGVLDCACVYPSPLHSREQMEELVEDMKCLLTKQFV